MAFDLIGALDTDDDKRTASAAALGALLRKDPSALPALSELLAELTRIDEKRPGIAEAFLVGALGTIRESVRAELVEWALDRLASRPPSAKKREEQEPALGAWFAGHAGALGRLVSLGYIELVASALGRGELGRDVTVALHARLCDEHARFESAMTLATRFGVLRPEVLAKCAITDVDEVAAHVLSRAYGPREEWVAQWIFFRTRPLTIPRGKEDGAVVLARLRANALLPGDLEAEIDRNALVGIPFPELPGTLRRSFTPRKDVVLDLAVRPKTREIEALRLVRARRGNATVHRLHPKS